MKKLLSIIGLLCVMLLIASCKKDETKYAPVAFVFEHSVDGISLQKGEMKYTNLAGNVYEVDELQYFISEISLMSSSGKQVSVTSDSAIHYIDLAIPSSAYWVPSDRIPVEEYDSISFIFGISESKNKTGLFVNPPQRDMFWPDMMGGGYHYMKMNGRWKAPGDIIRPFNFHLGIGMGEMGKFYQNFFRVTLPLKFDANEVSNRVYIVMNIEKWFQSPNLWDWNVIGGQIMQNQAAMHKACENGAHVFEARHDAGLID